MTPEKVRRAKLSVVKHASEESTSENGITRTRSSSENSSSGLVIDLNDEMSSLPQSTPGDHRQSLGVISKRQLRRKRRRMSLPTDEELFDEKFEETIRASAAKNNLTPMCVKKLLKKLVVNDHVFAMVRLKEEEERSKKEIEKKKQENDGDDEEDDEKEELQPKLTRLKAKQLKRQLYSIASLNEPTPDEEVAALIHKELSSDDDDEEYQPAEDEIASDDDPNTTVSDIDSQPRTPVSTVPITEQENESEILYTKDGLFKIPRARNDSHCSQTDQEQENIALRTRSKLCLTTTAIETLESTFIPPDITNDMYECDVVMDQAWKDFLEEFTKPLPSGDLEEDDDNDPEYVAAEGVPLDPEEMRAVKVSKKELNELVLELMEMGGAEDLLLEETLTETINESLSCSKINDRSSILDPPCLSDKSEAERDTSITEYGVTDTLNTTQSSDISYQTNNLILSTTAASSQSSQDLSSTSVGRGGDSNSYRSTAMGNLQKTDDSFSEVDGTPETSILNWSQSSNFFIQYSHLEESCTDVFGNNLVDKDTSKFQYPLQKRYSIRSTKVPVNVEITDTALGLNDMQFQLLHQQLRMHVQLTTQHFLQTYAHPKFWHMATKFKNMLQELEQIGETKPNVVPWNLPLAVECCQSWENELSEDNESNKSLIKFWCDETARGEQARSCNRFYHGDFHWRVREKIINCKAFMYPSLIPYKAFRCDLSNRSCGIFEAEEHLLAHWFARVHDQLNKEYNDQTQRKQVMKKPTVTAVCEYIAKHLCPTRSVKSLKNLVFRHKTRPGKKLNPFAFYMTNGYAPPFKHVLEVFDFNNIISLDMYQKGTLHHNWERYIFSNSRVSRIGLADNIGECEPEAKITPIKTPSWHEQPKPSDYQIQIRLLPAKECKTSEEYKNIFSAPVINDTQQVCWTKSDTGTPCCGSVNQNESVETDGILQEKHRSGHINGSKENVVNAQNNTVETLKCACSCQCVEHKCMYLKSREEHQTTLSTDCASKISEDLTRTTTEAVLPLSLPNSSVASVKHLNRTRSASLATLYLVLKRYCKELKAECNSELPMQLHSPDHPIFKTYFHFKQVEVYCRFLNELRKMSENFTAYQHRYKPVQQCHSQQQHGFLRLSYYYRTDGSLGVSAEYINDIVDNYCSMDDRDATFAFNYYEKVEETLLAAGRSDLLDQFLQILRNFDEFEDHVSALYYQVEDLLGESFPQLTEMFLSFLLPGQAAEVGKFFEHFILMNMGDFLEKLNVFFAKQPSQIKKVHACLNELSNDPDVTMDQVKMKVLPLLKGSTLLAEWFLQLFPSERPSELPISDYEHITLKKSQLTDNCDTEPVYEHISYIETHPEVTENAGGSNTIRYIQGRIFRGALPARLTFLAKNSVSKMSDQFNPLEKTNENSLCDDATLMAHAIRLNPVVYSPKGISYADVAHLLTENSGDPDVGLPQESLPASVNTEEELKTITAKKLLPKLPIKKRFNSPNSRKTASPNIDEKLSPVGSKGTDCSKKSTTGTASISVESKALVTARKLKSVIEAPKSVSLPDQRSEEMPNVLHEGKNIHNQVVAEQPLFSNDLTKSNDNKDKLEESEECSTDGVPSWTREEDKIILQDIIKGYTSVDTFVQQIEQKLSERTVEQIRSRFEFLLGMLRQVKQK